MNILRNLWVLRIRPALHALRGRPLIANCHLRSRIELLGMGPYMVVNNRLEALPGKRVTLSRREKDLVR